MIIRGSTVVAAPRELLWSVLCDPARLADALPDVSDVEIEDARRFSAVANPSTALGRTRLAMSFEVVGQRDGEFVHLDGAGTAGESAVAVSVDLSLADDEHGTAAHWTADVRVGGVLRSLLQRGLASLVNEQVAAMLAAGAAAA